MPLNSRLYPVRELLNAFRGAVENRPDLRLVLAGRRDQEDDFLIWNFIDEHRLADCIEYLPYYDVCREFPVKKQDCALWIERDTPSANLTSKSLLTRLESGPSSQTKLALFVTSFSPGKLEGNSALMRQWLDHLRAAGYRIHLLYYDLEMGLMTEQLRRAARRMADMVVEVDVATRIVGSNRNGLNVHVDDWCGIELLKAVEDQVGQFEYDVALVNYSFLSATFTRVATYTQKILITHDEFADRNRRMLAQGYPESGWLSLDRRGESLAFRRADVVVALQDGEAETFRSVSGGSVHVCVVAPVPEAPHIRPPQRTNKLRIGYLGSRNWVNEHNLVAFLQEWARRKTLVEGSELMLAGGICESLANFMPEELTKIVSPRMLGVVESLYTFFEECDVFVNPERGGTGIKIKTLDALAHGAAVLTTVAGSVGIGSGSRFHAAADAAGLAELVAECVADQAIVEQVRRESREAYTAYAALHRSSLTRLLGPAVRPLHRKRRQRAARRPTVVPDYVRQLWLTAPGGAAGGDVDGAPKVSIVIPVYNVEAYLEDCLRSVVGQDFEDFEIIVVDDQSLDGSRDIAERFAAADDRIRIVTPPKNAGLGPARNTGVRYARGVYILFLDSDDLLADPEVLGRLVSAAERTGCRVVIGSCVRLKPDGSIVDEDRERDRQSDGKPGTIVTGLDAFMGSFEILGRNYLPIRAWGTLIQRAYYEELRLDFPTGEHEDMPHVPFLYFHANGVFYDPLISVKYRERPGSLSNAKWSEQKLQRYSDLWKLMRSRMEDGGLREYVGDVAAVFASHLIWRVECHGTSPDVTEVAQATLSLILRDLSGATTSKLLFSILRAMTREPWNALRSQARHAELTDKIPSWALIEFHRERLGVPPLPRGPVPEALTVPKASVEVVCPNPAAAALCEVQEPPSRSTSFAANAAREAEIIAEFEAAASPRLKSFPSMLTLGDKALYFHAAKHFGFCGTIVDGGCFVGGTTTSLVEGLCQNQLVRDGGDTRGLIRVYDLFLIDDDYILQHLRENYPGREFKPQSSFLPIFEDNLRSDLDMLQVRPGDVTKIGYLDAQSIEILGVDFCKAPFITDFTVRHFLPRLLVGGLVLQQDFVHEYHPHIHLSMLRLADHFETYVELKWGGTVAYRCTRPVTETVVQEHFGDDLSWYNDKASNVPLLRRLIEECHYDENRWVFLLTLGMYHHTQGQVDLARDAFTEAQARFPHFEPSQLTRKLIGDQVQ